MARRIKPKETKRDWRWWTNILLNGAVVVSMVFGSIIVFTGVRPVSTQSLPTIEAPTLAPVTPMPAATPTPKAELDVNSWTTELASSVGTGSFPRAVAQSR